MKNLRIIILLLIACSTRYALAQSSHSKRHKSIISTKVVVLWHEGDTDSLLMPVVNGPYPELRKSLSDKKLFYGDDIDSVVANYKGCGCGITSFNYDITYESKDVISIILYAELQGAYPYTDETWLTLDIHTGKPYLLSNEINASGLKWIKNSYKTFLKESIKDDKQQVPEEDDESFNALMKSANQNPLDKYIFTDKGITFSSYGVLPHVNTAFEPFRDWPLSYARLKKYKKATAMVLR